MGARATIDDGLRLNGHKMLLQHLGYGVLKLGVWSFEHVICELGIWEDDLRFVYIVSGV